MMNILLAYVVYPITTAAYVEKALRKIANVKTIGPKLPQHLISQWKLEELKAPILDHDFPVDMTADMVVEQTKLNGFAPDLYLWIESVPGYFPQNIESMKCPKACYLVDTYSNHKWHLEWAKRFDYVFLADLSFVKPFRENGINAHWLPLACDPDTHNPKHALNTIHDISFVGTVVGGTDRKQYLDLLASQFNLHYERSFLEDMANTFAASKIVFNNAVGKTDLNMRFFEVMASGALLLSDMAENSGQGTLFEAQGDYALYMPSNLREVADYYLRDDMARTQVAKQGQSLVLAGHRYDDRVLQLLDVVTQKIKTTLDPQELRDQVQATLQSHRSSESVGMHPGNVNAQTICSSYIIPVLDYSPASQYNIKTLLRDLESIGGDVIVVFNSITVANDLKDHPRINHYAILNENIGVSRAWNIGLDICRTDYAFILNSDLHIKPEAINSLYVALKTFPKAAMVGPQGAYFNFEKMKDILYLAKEKFNKPMEVDAVSGFLFGINTKYFKDNKISFDNTYTPCYFEEWDIGYQIKAAGLKLYAVPTTDFDHEWSGSIRSYRQISYYDEKQTATQIQLRNAYLFKEKWRRYAKNQENPLFLDSIWIKILIIQFEIAISKKMPEVAADFIKQISHYFPGRSEIDACQKVFNNHYPDFSK